MARWPRRGFIFAFAGVIGLLVLGLVANQLFGNKMGESCADSYSCRGFLVGGVECLDIGEVSYCTIYCDRDDDCPAEWTCEGANPTVLAIETTSVDEVCVRPD
jgi:hypothetical protein